MVKEFGEKYGLEKDRFKLAAGVGKFTITHVLMRDSKKDYTVRVKIKDKDGVETDRLIEAKIKIAHITGISDVNKESVKYYSPNGAIVSACQDMLNDGADISGKLKEPIHVVEVKEEQGADKSKQPYLFFT